MPGEGKAMHTAPRLVNGERSLTTGRRLIRRHLGGFGGGLVPSRRGCLRHPANSPSLSANMDEGTDAACTEQSEDLVFFETNLLSFGSSYEWVNTEMVSSKDSFNEWGWAGM